MVARRPLVLLSGQPTELSPNDTLLGLSAGTLSAGSGLGGGGSLSNTVSTFVSLASAASGLIFTGNSLGVDGAVQSASFAAIASGSAAIVISASAQASGSAGISAASTAIASGNAVFSALNLNPGGTFITVTAAGAILPGYSVGFDDSRRVRAISASGPTLNSQNNFIGIAQTAASSGSAVTVRLPGSYDRTNSGLTTGSFYYVNPTNSGLTTTATQPAGWSGAVNWTPVGRAVNSTTLLLTDMI